MINPFTIIATAYKTWRHGHGFGVHSPLAFELLQQVLRLPKGYAWYDEDTVAHCFANEPRTTITPRQAVKIFRTVVYRQPPVIAVVSDNKTNAALLRKIATTACPAATFTTNTPEAHLVIADTSNYTSTLPAGHTQAMNHRLGAMTIFTGLDNKTRRQKFNLLTRDFSGLVLDSRRSLAITVGRQHLPQQKINATF